MFKSLQKCNISKAKKQEQFQKLNLKMLSEWQMTGTDSRNVFKSLQKYIIRIARSKDSFKSLFQIVIKLACGWNRMRKVCKCLQKHIIRIAKKQGQFQKQCFKMLSK